MVLRVLPQMIYGIGDCTDVLVQSGQMRIATIRTQRIGRL